MPRDVKFSQKAFNELTEWATTDRKILLKIHELIAECCRTPFDGKGKPEPLKGNLKGYWSRRINQEHRLVYGVTEESINILSCKGHYE
ncbi:type II toxin-antitoxin system mRNA interferase toxin YoeB [Spirosoma harenae]